MPARGCFIGPGETAARKHHESETLGGGRIAARQSRARTAGGGCIERGGARTGRGSRALRGAARGTALTGSRSAFAPRSPSARLRGRGADGLGGRLSARRPAADPSPHPRSTAAAGAAARASVYAERDRKSVV